MLLGAVDLVDTDSWHRMIGVNLSGILNLTHPALPLLRAAAQSERQVADIVNIGSIASLTQHAGTSAYSMTKAGVDAFSESLRKEMAPHAVRVHVIRPGATKTELSSHNPPEVMTGSRERMKNVTYQQPDDIADAVSYVVTRPANICIGELVIRPTSQA